MVTDQSLRDAFEDCGRVWLRNAISEADLALFDSAVAGGAKAGQRLDASTALKGAFVRRKFIALCCPASCAKGHARPDHRVQQV
jgi:hypothetical protein